MGQVGTGKTYTLFGAGDALPSSEGICVRVLAALFDKIHAESFNRGRSSNDQKYYRVGISLWDIGANEVQDLISPSNNVGAS